jgi:hypothetical protein
MAPYDYCGTASTGLYSTNSATSTGLYSTNSATSTSLYSTNSATSTSGYADCKHNYYNSNNLYIKNTKIIYQPCQSWNSPGDDYSTAGCFIKPYINYNINQYNIETTTSYDNWVVWHPLSLPVASPGERLKQILQSRQGPLIIGTRKAIAPSAPERELRARETLQRVVGELQYRKFLKHGFITVRAKSGLVYQLFHNSTYAWRDGKRVEHLCVVLRGDFPPTDTLIVRYLMILNNEEQFRATANRSQACHSGNPFDAGQRQDLRSLVEIFRELKLAA